MYYYLQHFYYQLSTLKYEKKKRTAIDILYENSKSKQYLYIKERYSANPMNHQPNISIFIFFF